ncbi:MAG: N-6 DNA methylase, partial [Methyloprofundus sp.]|nr:N-6 DNA methylase [Methyloprofundus sp.]
KTKPMKFDEFQTEIDWWGHEADGFANRVETNQAWCVSIDEIIDRNYNLDIKNPHQEEVEIHDPQQLLASYQQQQTELQQLRDQLKAILGNALAGKA